MGNERLNAKTVSPGQSRNEIVQQVPINTASNRQPRWLGLARIHLADH